MPQPFSKVVQPPQTITIQPDTAAKQPELAALVAQAIGIWALVENTLGGTLVDMLGAKASPAIAMYGAIHDTARRAALKATAGLVLSIDNHKLFEALMRVHKTHAKQRDKFAHWIWAYCPTAPQYVVLINPVKWIQQHAMFSDVRFQQSYQNTTLTFEYHGPDEWECYSKIELQRITENFSLVLKLFRSFQTLVGPRVSKLEPRFSEIDDEIYNQIYNFLSTHPLVLTELNRLAQDQIP
jgi:hypothetical protein